ncbi:non-homologous end joining protein Ku [Peterkaempfera bronchialis]|uniref:Non-homologous end joining protein Ku n=1 Tax=Peterkaempfera bronchialis TaxID=2126346 RepID=A0A345SSE8_9ACTN|nr:Ku protein [Peterkaempfera bronchialis]AXI76653.1 Ku protein [Peterkaempfera bronchialis]
MRSSWKGAITFGLVSIPVQLFPATEEHGVSLHQVHAEDGGRIRVKRYCEKENREVPYAEIAKAYESPDGRTAVLTDADLSELPLPSKKIIDVLAFVDASEVDPLLLAKPYYLQTATPAAAKPYVLLREALAGTGRAAVTKITLRTRESLALLRVRGDLLVLQTMLWPDEVRSASGLEPQGKVEVRPQELSMATSLMDTLSEDFDLQALHDDYQHALDTLVAAKLEGVEPPSEEEAGEGAPDNVIDLMAALSASVKAAERSRTAGEPEEPEEGKPPRKSAAKQPAARKTARKQQPEAKKTASSGGRKSPEKTAGKAGGQPAEKTGEKPAKKTAAARRRASA